MAIGSCVGLDADSDAEHLALDALVVGERSAVHREIEYCSSNQGTEGDCFRVSSPSMIEVLWFSFITGVT